MHKSEGICDLSQTFNNIEMKLETRPQYCCKPVRDRLHSVRKASAPVTKEWNQWWHVWHGKAFKGVWFVFLASWMSGIMSRITGQRLAEWIVFDLQPTVLWTVILHPILKIWICLFMFDSFRLHSSVLSGEKCRY